MQFGILKGLMTVMYIQLLRFKEKLSFTFLPSIEKINQSALTIRVGFWNISQGILMRQPLECLISTSQGMKSLWS